MDSLTLTQDQMSKVLDELNGIGTGSFDIEIEIDDTLTVQATGWLEIDGYVEDDYFSGTGAFVETYRAANIELTAQVYDEETNEVTDYQLDKTQEQQAERYLQAI